MNELIQKLRSNLSLVIKGKPEKIDLVICSFLAGGNVLLTDVPGVGKTTLARAMALSMGGSFRRIQFTPDLLPADILGGSIYNPREGSFSFREGPVFANVVLADEINRASPRTQSSLLEAMAEGQVSIEGACRPLPQPFWVIATQNPVEHHGTYPLPEAQLDRFCIELELGYPGSEDELQILSSHDEGSPIERLKPVVDPETMVRCQREVCRIHVDEDIGKYIVHIANKTRKDNRLSLGVSPRGGMTLYRMAQARAYMDGRASVLPHDAKSLAVSVLAHRVALETRARYSGVETAAVIREIVESSPVPV